MLRTSRKRCRAGPTGGRRHARPPLAAGGGHGAVFPRAAEPDRSGTVSDHARVRPRSRPLRMLVPEVVPVEETSSSGLADQIFDQCERGKAVKASTSVFESCVCAPFVHVA